ncbi:MAG TPA: ArsB/NhaD family transporter [Bryobacteraceae bacterium]|nr:ArsB/NhaD family transporter [Bryobacteraceae bacterium]
MPAPDVAALSILAVTVGIALGRPRIGAIQVHHSHAAIIGASLCLVTGLVPLDLGWHALQVLARPLVTIVSLMVMTLVAERLGLFALLGRGIARAAGGSGRRLFTYLFFAGALTGALFTNDAAVLILTPLVCDLIREIETDQWRESNKLPYYFAVLYVANLVGALVISNPINLIVSSIFGISFLEYAAWMALPALLSVFTSYFGLLWFFRDAIPERFEYSGRRDWPERNAATLWICAATLLLTLVGFFTGNLAGIPLWAVAAAGALGLTALYSTRPGSNLTAILRGVGWDVIVFVVGIFIVAYGLRAAGLASQLGRLLQALAGTSLSALSSVTAISAAVCSSVMNNHPTANIMAMVIDDFGKPAAESKLLALSALIGGDLGPKMLPIGSLAALLWFRMLRDRGVTVSHRLYIRIGIPVTLCAVALSVTVLNLEYILWSR